MHMSDAVPLIGLLLASPLRGLAQTGRNPCADLGHRVYGKYASVAQKAALQDTAAGSRQLKNAVSALETPLETLLSTQTRFMFNKTLSTPTSKDTVTPLAARFQSLFRPGATGPDILSVQASINSIYDNTTTAHDRAVFFRALNEALALQINDEL